MPGIVFTQRHGASQQSHCAWQKTQTNGPWLVLQVMRKALNFKEK